MCFVANLIPCTCKKAEEILTTDMKVNTKLVLMTKFGLYNGNNAMSFVRHQRLTTSIIRTANLKPKFNKYLVMKMGKGLNENFEEK